ncbi:hypothetical protein DKP78_19265, partial [Enterococcus faecium]
RVAHRGVAGGGGGAGGAVRAGDRDRHRISGIAGGQPGADRADRVRVRIGRQRADAGIDTVAARLGQGRGDQAPVPAPLRLP